MDTNKEYIKMCEKAVEIQHLWMPKPVDCYSCHNYKEICWIDHRDKIAWIDHKDRIAIVTSIKCFKRTKIWLPRQDQLQDIVKEGKPDHKLLLDLLFVTQIYDYTMDHKETRGEYSTCNSMEQLWLAFVMKEKYNKVWDVKEWVMIDE